ncbi:hypothetical protein J7L48_07880 [bacterium]|nr:hypothetical protein [bacterium]
MKKFYLIDTSSIIFRSYYAITHLNTSAGFPTNAIYGVIKSLNKIREDLKPNYICTVYDSIGKTFRKELTADYKANRAKVPDDLIAQFPHIEEIIHLFGIPSLRIEGLEADDVIASLIKKFYNEYDKFIIITGDKDLFQLIDDKVIIFDPKANIEYDKEKTFEKFNVYPKQIRDYLSLVGDASDNVKGAPGIGKKTAAILLGKYGNIEKIYEHMDELKPGQIRGLEEFSQYREQTIELITLVEDAKISVNLNELKIKQPNIQYLVSKLKELELFSLINDLNMEQEEEKIEIQEFDSFDMGKEIFSKLYNDKIFLFNGNTATYTSIEKCKEIFNRDIHFISYNMKEDLKTLMKNDFPLPKKYFDLIIGEHLIKGGKRYVEFKDLESEYVINKNVSFSSNNLLINEINILKELYKGYQIYKKMREFNSFNETFENALRKIELPLIPVLAQMELNGITIDIDAMREIKILYKKKINLLEKETLELCGENFNLDSPKQLREILFVKLSMQPGKKTKTGFSTDSSVLSTLLRTTQNPTHVQILKNVLEYRELSKMVNTFINGFAKYVSKNNNKVHSTFHQTVTTTGRLSSESPNLQNLPIKTERGRVLRKLFIPEHKENLLLSLDYSQVELRVLANFSHDPGLVNAFKNDIDIHSLTTSKILNIPIEDVKKEDRRIGKILNFGIIYGMGPYHLSQSMNIGMKEAKNFIEAYYETYAGVKKYQDGLILNALETGYVETLFKRRRYIPELLSKNDRIKKSGIRAAINAPIQGTASELIKLAMIKIYSMDLPLQLIIQIHDELVFEGNNKDIEVYSRTIKEIMENIVELDVKLKVDYKIGKNLLEVH